LDGKDKASASFEKRFTRFFHNGGMLQRQKKTVFQIDRALGASAFSGANGLPAAAQSPAFSCPRLCANFTFP